MDKASVSSGVTSQMQDVKSQMDQFRLYLQIQQERSNESQHGNSSKNFSNSGRFVSPLRNLQSNNKSRTTPRRPFQTKILYSPIEIPTTTITPKTKKKFDTSSLLSASDSSSDDEIDALLKRRKSSGSPSPFKKYHFSKDPKIGLSKYSTSAEQSVKSIAKDTEMPHSDSTEISKDEILFSDSNSDSSDSNHAGSTHFDRKRQGVSSSNKHLNKLKILRSMKLVDKMMSESVNKKKKNAKVKLKISKSFAVPYSGSYEEGEVFKIEQEGNSDDDSSKDDILSHSDSDDAEFINFIPPVADEIDAKQDSKGKNNNLNENSPNSENMTQKENVDHQNPIEEEAVVRIKDIPDVEMPKVDLNFLNDDDEEKSSSESDKDSVNALLNEVQAICTILDEEEEDESK